MTTWLWEHASRQARHRARVPGCRPSGPPSEAAGLSLTLLPMHIGRDLHRMQNRAPFVRAFYFPPGSLVFFGRDVGICHALIIDHPITGIQRVVDVIDILDPILIEILILPLELELDSTLEQELEFGLSHKISVTISPPHLPHKHRVVLGVVELPQQIHLRQAAGLGRAFETVTSEILDL
jgi:hypothetical protein